MLAKWLLGRMGDRSLYGFLHKPALFCVEVLKPGYCCNQSHLFCSAIPEGVTAVQNILAQMNIGALKTDCDIVTRICQAVSRRAAYLCAAGKSSF